MLPKTRSVFIVDGQWKQLQTYSLHNKNANSNHQHWWLWQSMQDIQRCSPPSLGLPHSDHCCYMPESPPSNPRKRQYTEQYFLQLIRTSSPQLMRQKLRHPTTRSQLPPVYWDNLSKLWLTELALRELNQRNIQPASNLSPPQYRRPRRPITWNFLAKLKRNRCVTQSALDFLCHCGPVTLKEIRLLAGYGGPDLSDLKGVSITS